MNKAKPKITKKTFKKWQRVVDVISEMADVPTAMIMRTIASDHFVAVNNNNSDNPYNEGQNFTLNKKLYCYGVYENDGELIVEDAACDARWDDNDDLEFGMSFYIGYPLKWPDGEVFGTICVLDRSRNKRALMFKKALREFCTLVEADLATLMEVEKRKHAEAKLRQTIENREAVIDRRTNALEEANTALRVLLESIESSKKEMEEKIAGQIQGLVLPHIGKLRHLDAEQALQSAYLEILETNLKQIASPLSSKMAETMAILTPMEAEIMQMIVRGSTTKEIAKTLSRGTSTIDFHRDNIRRKLGLRNCGTNLRQHLMALQ